MEYDALLAVQGSEPLYISPFRPSRPTAHTPPPLSFNPAQWHLPLMGLPAAWEHTGGEGTVIAVVDTGVLLTHPDLRPHLLPGWDFVDSDPDPSDTAGHGTHVAGLTAANGLVLGAAPEASLLPVRVLSGTSGGSAFTVAQGILWAAGRLNAGDCTPASPPGPTCNPHRAGVINLSLGTPEYSEALAQAVREAQAAGAVVVAAAGNDGGSALSYPAALPGVVSVTALAGPRTAYQPGYASKGPGIWLSAYGGDIANDQDGDGTPDGLLSTDRRPDGSAGYGLRMGTSMAAPLVSGLAALALASGTPADLVRSTLAATATDLGVLGYDSKFGHGLATGRTATPSAPRSYLLALDRAGRLKGWTLVQTDLSFTLTDLPPGEPLTLRAASDVDGDGVLGEAGELTSSPLGFTALGGKVQTLDPIPLTPSDGTAAVSLRPTP